MAAAEGNLRTAHAPGWRTPLVIIICGCADCPVELRAAVEPRFFRAADGPGVFLGARRVRPGARHSKPVVGAGPAGCRRDRRPVRRPARDVRRGGSLRRRAVHDALRRDAAVAGYRRRSLDRLWTIRLFVQPGAIGIQQAAAARAARPGARRRHRRGIVRTIPVRAVRRRLDRQFRLAGGADGVRRC